MPGKARQPVPRRLEATRRRFETWRRKRGKGRTRIPEPLWASAVKLAREYGLYRTARALRLDYTCLKKRVAESAGRLPLRSAAFVEVLPETARSGECIVEVENAYGAKMRIHLKGQEVPDLAALTKSFLLSTE